MPCYPLFYKVCLHFLSPSHSHLSFNLAKCFLHGHPFQTPFLHCSIQLTHKAKERAHGARTEDGKGRVWAQPDRHEHSGGRSKTSAHQRRLRFLRRHEKELFPKGKPQSTVWMLLRRQVRTGSERFQILLISALKLPLLQKQLKSLWQVTFHI